MSFELKLAWKYFRSRRKSLARFTAVLAVAGIASGVASLIVAQALSSGFADEMQDKILANTAHVSVFSADGGDIENWTETKEKLENTENVTEVSATALESAFVIGAETVSHALLQVQSAKAKAQSSNQIEISIGEQLAEKTNLKTGDQTELVVLENQSEPKRVKVTVVEIFRTGLYEYDATWIRLSPEAFARLHGRKAFTPQILNVSVRDIYRARETAGKIKNILGENFKVLDWQETNQPLFAALSLERKVSLAIISLIIFIAVLNITTTLALLVGERRLDIAVLRTCGARTRSLISIFLLEGLLLGFFGIVFGLIAGLLACFLGNRFRVINLSAEVYSLSYIPFRPNVSSVVLTISVALAACLAASLYPAYKASRIKPLENLQMR